MLNLLKLLIQTIMAASIVACLFFIYEIKQELSTFPRLRDLYLQQNKERPANMKDSLWNAPLVKINGSVEVTGSVDIDNTISIDQAGHRPIPVEIK
jgi:hypothetical protein